MDNSYKSKASAEGESSLDPSSEPLCRVQMGRLQLASTPQCDCICISIPVFYKCQSIVDVENCRVQEKCYDLVPIVSASYGEDKYFIYFHFIPTEPTCE